MTTARDVIAKWFIDAEWGDSDVCDLAAESMLCCIEDAPESVRQELAALLNPWRPIETAPKDGTPFIGYCPREVDRPGYNQPPEPASRIAIVWNGQANPDQPRNVSWVAADVQVELYSGSELTGSWVEYEFTSVEPTHWLPLRAPPSEDK